MTATITAEIVKRALTSKLSVKRIKKSVKIANQKKIMNGKIMMYSRKLKLALISLVVVGLLILLYLFKFNPKMFFVAMNL